MYSLIWNDLGEISVIKLQPFLKKSSFEKISQILQSVLPFLRTPGFFAVRYSKESRQVVLSV